MSEHAKNLKSALETAALQRGELAVAKRSVISALKPTAIAFRALDKTKAAAKPFAEQAVRVISDHPIPVVGLVAGTVAFRFRRPLARLTHRGAGWIRPHLTELLRQLQAQGSAGEQIVGELTKFFSAHR